MPVGGLNYHEFVELIPSVERTDVNAPKGGPFSYMPCLLLDNLIPVIVGTNFYGFNKRQARIAAQGGDFDIDGDLGEIQANFTRCGLPGSIGKFPVIDAGRQFLDLPLISKLPTGAWVYSYLDYRLDFRDVPESGRRDRHRAAFHRRHANPEQLPGCPLVQIFRRLAN